MDLCHRSCRSCSLCNSSIQSVCGSASGVKRPETLKTKTKKPTNLEPHLPDLSFCKCRLPPPNPPAVTYFSKSSGSLNNLGCRCSPGPIRGQPHLTCPLPRHGVLHFWTLGEGLTRPPCLCRPWRVSCAFVNVCYIVTVTAAMRWPVASDGFGDQDLKAVAGHCFQARSADRAGK